MVKQMTIQHVDPNAVAIMAAIIWKTGGDLGACVRLARELMRETEKQMVHEATMRNVGKS